MKKEEIVRFINNKAIDKNGIMLLSYNDAKEAVALCKKSGIAVLGIDAFSLYESAIQPHLDKSIDFSSEFISYITPEDYFGQFDDRCKKLFFEITI